jgi:hypothetical protein
VPHLIGSEEHARILWKWGGFESTLGAFPGLAVAELRMIRGVSRAARKRLARIFASLAPQSRAVALAALVAATRPGCPATIQLPPARAPARPRVCRHVRTAIASRAP